MPEKLWPARREDGSVSVAVRFTTPGSGASAAIRNRLQKWGEWITVERGVNLLETLVRLPTATESHEYVEVTFDGRPGSRRWRDWMGSLVRDVEMNVPGVTYILIDLVGGETRGDTRRST